MLVCPNCGNDTVLVAEETYFYANTYLFFCTSVKAHDEYAKACCTRCRWEGERKHLIEKEEE